MDIAFLPNVQESIMDELRTTEGMIFRDECAKKLFLDTKYFVFDTLYSAWKTKDENDYQTYLDLCLLWEESFFKELVDRASTIREISDRLINVTVLYAKYLYASSHPENGVSIKKPKLENLLKGMFTRLSKIHHIRNGSFFQLDPLKQDFVFRDTFRQSLGNDCIEITSQSIESKYEKIDSIKDENEKIEHFVKDDFNCVLNNVIENRKIVLPDNKSTISGRKTVLPELSSGRKTVLPELSSDTKTVLPELSSDIKTVLPELTDNKTTIDNKSIIDDKTTINKSIIDQDKKIKQKSQLPTLSDLASRKDPNEIYPDDSISHVMGKMISSQSIAPTHVSSISHGSQFKMPTIRRVKLDDEEM